MDESASHHGFLATGTDGNFSQYLVEPGRYLLVARMKSIDQASDASTSRAHQCHQHRLVSRIKINHVEQYFQNPRNIPTFCHLFDSMCLRSRRQDCRQERRVLFSFGLPSIRVELPKNRASPHPRRRDLGTREGLWRVIPSIGDGPGRSGHEARILRLLLRERQRRG